MQIVYDLIVIGGGPAGLMAGIRASQSGKNVLILERNIGAGRKLLMTGKGRSNITNAENDIHQWVMKFGQNGKFLYHAFSVFSSADMMQFCEENDVPLKVERGNRVFPVSDNAHEVLKMLLSQFEGEIGYGSLVESITKPDDRFELITTKGVYRAHNVLISTGGLSYPEIGSDGLGFRLAQELGHTVTKLTPSLTPIVLKETKVSKLEGISLKNVEITARDTVGHSVSRFGEALFTSHGMSGPIVIDMSGEVGDLLESGEVTLSIDFKPRISRDDLDLEIQEILKAQSNKQVKNILSKYLPKKVFEEISRDQEFGDIVAHQFTREMRERFVDELKGMTYTVHSLYGYQKAIVTRGGILLSEVDPKTCQSRKVSGLYFAGEVLDLDGPTGGYNLQVAWSTGYLVGESV